MGTGKSSVGRILAKRMKREHVDLDRWIEDREGRKIRDIFEKDGEPRFRALERDAVRHWASRTDIVLTTGGGTVVDPENRAALKENGLLVTLLAKPETIYQRVKNSKHRPLLSGQEDLLAHIRRMLEERRPHYQQSDFYFDTDGKSAAQVASLVLRVVSQKV